MSIRVDSWFNREIFLCLYEREYKRTIYIDEGTDNVNEVKDSKWWEDVFLTVVLIAGVAGVTIFYVAVMVLAFVHATIETLTGRKEKCKR